MGVARRHRVEAISLDGQWRLVEAKPQATRRSSISDRERWITGAVPGDVGQALLDAGRIPDPRWGDNHRECQWIVDRDWWYRRTFNLPSGFPTTHAELICDSIDFLGEVWLNGELLGETSNAFRAYSFDVAPHLARGQNDLAVRLRALGPILDAAGPWRENKRATDARLRYRTCQCLFGWDWAPVLPSIGLGSVRLLGCDTVRVDDVRVRTHVSGQVDVFVELTSKPERPVTLDFALRGHGARLDARQTTVFGRNTQTFYIQNPRLWWPRGYGDQPLYDLTVRLVEGRRVVDTRTIRFGLREISQFEERGAEDQFLSWGLTVNGVKVQIKGSNWVPVDLFHHTPRPERYRRLIARAAEANFNMIRVWGGGIYEPDIFYDLCDAAGLLVWQDFMFASGAYTVDDPVFRHEITLEAEFQVRRLRNHPSLAAWCGCNEDSSSWSYTRRQGQELYNVILPGVVAVQDGTVPYVVSSPWSHGDYGNLPSSGNCHRSCYKFCRDSQDPPRPESWRHYRRAFETLISFNSEFPVNGPPRREALERYMPRDQLWPFNDLWMRRNRMPSHDHQAEFAAACVGPVTDLNSFLKGAMVVHAEHTRGEFENARRSWPDCGGTMSWMFNDIWPTANWSIVDFYGLPKPAFYASKRACAPVVPIILDLGGEYRCYVSNDTPKAVRARLEFAQEDFAGPTGWRKVKALTIPANTSLLVFAQYHSPPPAPLEVVSQGWSREAVSAPTRPPESRRTDDAWSAAKTERKLAHAVDLSPGTWMDSYLVARLTVNGETQEAVFFPHLWRGIDWPDPGLRLRILGRSRRHGRHITRCAVATKRFARQVHLDVPDLADAVFSDNFFDLTAGRRRVIEIETARRLANADLRLGHWLTDWR